jgi:hypothetical protein
MLIASYVAEVKVRSMTGLSTQAATIRLGQDLAGDS